VNRLFGWSYPPGCSGPPDEADPPEVCPVCGADNADDEGNAICGEAPDFCSVACRDRYVAEQRAADDAYAAALIEEDRIAAEWRAMCEKETEP
jgi:hypothetical protein